MGSKFSTIEGSSSSLSDSNKIIELIQSISPAFSSSSFLKICSKPENISFNRLAQLKKTSATEKEIDHYLRDEVGVSSLFHRKILIQRFLRLTIIEDEEQEEEEEEEGGGESLKRGGKGNENNGKGSKNERGWIEISGMVSVSDLNDTFLRAEEGYPLDMETLFYWQENPPEANFTNLIQERRYLYEQRVNLYEAATADDLFNLGWCYDYGIGGEQDMTKAISFYHRAIELGSLKALNQLGWCYHYGRGVEKDEKKAYEIYRAAADKGHVMSFNQLGFCYSTGLGVPKNDSEKLKWLTLGFEGGNISAAHNLGCVEEKNFDRALEYHYLATELGCHDSDREIAIIFFNKKDYTTCLRWALLGTTVGMLYAARCYLALDEKVKATYWMKKAAEKGNIYAMNEYGEMLELGNGVTQDIGDFQWYYMASLRGNDFAMYNLSCLYYDGWGSDPITGFKWLIISAELGNSFSIQALAYCYQPGVEISKSLQRSLTWHEKRPKVDSRAKEDIDELLERNPQLFLKINRYL